MHDLFSAFRDETFDPEDTNYLIGVAYGASIFLILGILVCIALPITLCCMSRNKSCCRTLRNENPKSSSIRWWIIATYAGGIVGAVLSLLGFINVNHAIDSLSDKVDIVGDLLSVGVNVARISVNLLSQTGAYLKEATGSLLECLGPDSPQLPAVTLATDKLEDAMAVAQENFQELADKAMQETAGRAYDISDTINDTESVRVLVTGIIFGMDCFIFAIFAISGIVLLVKRDDTMRWLIKASRCSTIISAPMGMVVIVGAWLITAGAVAIAMLSGDYCINPEQNTYAVADGPYVSYYLTCEGPNPALEAITRILNGIQDSSSSLAEMIQANAETGDGLLADSQCLGSGENLDAFSRAFYGVYKLGETGGSYLSCRTINTVSTVSVCLPRLYFRNLMKHLIFLPIAVISENFPRRGVQRFGARSATAMGGKHYSCCLLDVPDAGVAYPPISG
jgi:hypothetical protein